MAWTDPAQDRDQWQVLTFGFCKALGISGADERLLASREGLNFIEGTFGPKGEEVK